MAKNNKLIEQCKFMYKKIKNITPEVYACIALSLYRKYGWEYEQIRELFDVSQDIWNECIHLDIDMLQMCEEETGIELRAME